jgi:hypothetical protein
MRELVVIAVVVLLVVLGPVAIIWALNTLFPALAIPYNLDTWCAVVVLNGFAITTIYRNK